MSHTTEIKSVPIKDVKALRQAIAELQKTHNVDCELLENAAPRMYYGNQFEKSTGKKVAEYCLKLNKGKYDVGFNAQYADERAVAQKKVSKYDMVFDTWNGEVAKYLGHTDPQENEDKALAAVGKLTQLYTKHATINAARQSGYNVRSTKMDANGNLQLVLASV